MSNLNDENTETFSGVASGATTDSVAVNSTDNGELCTAFIDDNAGGAPADFTIIAERYSEAEDRWMEYARSSVTGASSPQSVTDEAVPSQMRYKLVNDTAGAADYRLSVVSY